MAFLIAALSALPGSADALDMRDWYCVCFLRRSFVSSMARTYKRQYLIVFIGDALYCMAALEESQELCFSDQVMVCKNLYKRRRRQKTSFSKPEKLMVVLTGAACCHLLHLLKTWGRQGTTWF